jgi:tRNA pseudouridine55 synthase
MSARRGQRLDGFVVLDKSTGITSTQAMARVRRVFDAAKAGHAGTLDPLASGILIIALGEATKLVPLIMGRRKTYRFTVVWGDGRDSDDAEGRPVATSPVRPDRAAIEAALPRFIGTIDQIPPAYSAIKIAGRPAYARSRAGETLDLSPRPVVIHALRLLACSEVDAAEFEVECGKGMYVRGLARDLAAALGTLGHVRALRRTALGNWPESAAISLDSLESLRHSAGHLAHLQAVETALDDIPALAVTEQQGSDLARGRPARIARAELAARALAPGAMVAAIARGRLIALGVVEGDNLKPRRVLNLAGLPVRL